MSGTTSKHPEQDEESQGAVQANADQDEDDVDLDLDAALFGDDDDDNAEPSAEGRDCGRDWAYEACLTYLSRQHVKLPTVLQAQRH